MDVAEATPCPNFCRLATVIALVMVLGLTGCATREEIVSPRIAFISQRIDTNGDGDDFHLYLMNPDGSNQVKLSDIPVGFGMSWSSDGKNIAASFKANKGWNIGLIDVEQGTVDYLTNDANIDTEPAFSPDGQFIAFASDRAGGSFQIHVMKADGTDIRPLTDGDGEALHPTWSPDGRLIAFQIRYPEQAAFIRVVDLNGNVVKEIKSSTGGSLEWPEFSPDGGTIACYESRLELGNQLMLFSFPEESTPGKALGYGLFPDWSPDGQEVIFSTSAGDLRSDEICVTDVEGGELRCLTNNEFLDACPTWIGSP